MKKLNVIMTSAVCASLMAVSASAASNECVSVFDSINRINAIVNGVNISNCAPQGIIQSIISNCINGQLPIFPEIPDIDPETPEQVLEPGERIYNIERMFNKAAGMKPEDDRLPKRLLTEPVVSGPSKGMTSKLEVTLPEYYEVRGWDNAFPTEETLKRLGLDECIAN